MYVLIIHFTIKDIEAIEHNIIEYIVARQLVHMFVISILCLIKINRYSSIEVKFIVYKYMKHGQSKLADCSEVSQSIKNTLNNMCFKEKP